MNDTTAYDKTIEANLLAIGNKRLSPVENRIAARLIATIFTQFPLGVIVMDDDDDEYVTTPETTLALMGAADEQYLFPVVEVNGTEPVYDGRLMLTWGEGVDCLCDWTLTPEIKAIANTVMQLTDEIIEES